MKVYPGKSILKEIAIGRIQFHSKEEHTVSRESISDTRQEWERYLKAKEQAADELNTLYEKALKEVGETGAAIFEVHGMMLDDDDFNDSVKNIIEAQEVNAEYAVASTGDNFSQMFAQMDDEYFQARSADIKDIAERVVRILLGKHKEQNTDNEPFILVAEDLAPSETVQMDKSKLLGFVTELGSSNSHTAILARTMNIPALIGIPVSEEMDGMLAIIDGVEGKMILEPDAAVLEEYRKKKAESEKRKVLLQQLKGKEDITLDGKKIRLYANIGGIGDVASVLSNDADGIGLFRSEFLYLEKETYPTEEEQFQAYRTVVETMGKKKVIIRTLDIGADKQADYFQLGHEDNPAMGYRAIRICLDRPEIFKTQLRAILMASAYGNVGIMYPMIISVEEVIRAKQYLEEAKAQLDQRGIRYGEVEQGIMIETPASVMISGQLAKEVDFFSIGTNDLTQYTLAIDRQNAKLDNIYDSHHPAVLEMIRMTVENGHKENCWVGICGELGADTTLTETFLKMGVDELSVSPGRVLPIREIIRNTRINL